MGRARLCCTTRPGGTTTEQSYNAAGSTTKAVGQGTETCINYRADGSASGGTVTGDGVVPKGIPELETVLKGVFERQRFLDLLADLDKAGGGGKPE